jgi:hypothetical protein
MKTNPVDRRWPVHGWIGLVLVGLSWGLNWTRSGLRTHLLFFPLWLGYSLTIDALVWVRKGSSMLKRNPNAYVGLFLISAPAWWLFELINWRTQNWFYEGRQLFKDWQYFLFASFSFSTVMPAVFGTAELISTLGAVRRLRRGPAIPLNRRALVGFFVAGWTMLALLLIWPRYFFPLVWLSVYFILDPINVWLGHRSVLSSVARGNWRPVLSAAGGVLICGFFWEMWNFYSYPKWIYQVPFFDFLHVFEMPLLGYLGYIPFSLELFALYYLVSGLWELKGRERFIQLT